MIKQGKSQFTFLGERKYLMDLIKTFSNYNLFMDKELTEIQEILFMNSEKNNLFFVSSHNRINRDQLIKFIAQENKQKNFLFIEESDFVVLNQNVIYINQEKCIHWICDQLEIDFQTEFLNIENNFFDVLFQFKITNQLKLPVKYYQNMDCIFFLRQKLYKLKTSAKTPEKKELLKNILFRLEFSFKKTGITGLFSYYLLLEKFL